MTAMLAPVLTLRTSGRKLFTPLSLFAAGEQGAWYDPSDMSTLFQDSAGTVPVTAVEQPVGRILDKSGRGNHATQATTTKRPIYSRRVNLLTKTEQFEDGVWFKGGYGGGLHPTVIANDASGPASDGFADKVTFSAGAGAQSLLYATAAFSPAVYRGVLCLKAASPGDVGKIIALRHASGAAYLLITLTADYQVISRNETALAAVGGSLDIALRPDVGTSSGEVSIHLAYASLTLTTDAHLPYQRVNTATDYDADPAKFPAYLRFDGVDDALQTGNIDFTGTDKMTVWAGVTKLSDAAAFPVILELGITPRRFSLYQNLAAEADKYTVSVVGLNDAWGAAGPVLPAPATSVITVRADCVAANRALAARLRINQTDYALSGGNYNAPNGVNFGNYPLYIGARAGTSLYFNGRLYSLIVRGAQTSLSQIEATELYMKKKVGIA